MILTATLMLVMAGQKREAHLRARGPGRSRFCLHLIKDVDPGDIGAKQSFVASRGHDEFKWQALLLVVAAFARHGRASSRPSTFLLWWSRTWTALTAKSPRR